MESTLLFSSTLSLSKSFISSTPLSQRLFSTACPGELVHFQLRRCEFSGVRSGPLVRGLGTVDPHWIRFQCPASSAPSFASGGGGSDGIDGNGGGGGEGDGDGAAEGGEGKSTAVAAGAEDDSALSSDVIVLHVGGMTCGGCAAKVKRILEGQPQVSSANVDLATETATVWPVSEAKVAPNWRKDLGEALAKHLTSCGFNSNLQDQGAVEEEIPS
ncbi:copper-transporting ATPase PAA1, chloroplastic-like [Olea europaea var. sylvestris]|uniref:copper-transporting ATPase PAA1, chloroplastic-like n=1 Tax=Olea europaea var. sylvestris TaxID=158386 RepID=UPI000C1D177E|nr:copper-transporting ATPase PAA1, chloroplastic-like [Olea europaea var. sylvestris]XP_022861289.1 copper-transporting ATPase PAA1, chloroplastic-like [Olea europaea var. sylvestris]